MTNELQEKFLVYQLLEKRLEELKQEQALIERRFIEIETTKQAVADFKKMKEKNDVLIPLGPDCYAFGEIKDLKKVLVNLGAGILTINELESAEEILEKRKKEIENLINEIQEEAKEIIEKMNQLAPEIQELVKSAQNQ